MALLDSVRNAEPGMRRFRLKIPASVLETLFFLSFSLVVDALFLNGTRFRDWSYHPFWCIVLLITVQYGTNAGLLATLASTAALLTGNIPSRTVSQDVYAWVGEIVRLPLLWFLASIILGEIRIRQIRERDQLREKLASAGQREASLTDAYRRLNSLRQTLEARVAGQLKTAVGIHDAARGIDKLDPDDVLLGVSALMKVVINPKQFSLFLLSGNKLEARLQHQWPEESQWPRSYGPESELFREIVGKRRFLCQSSAADEHLLRGDGVLAGPLLTAEGRVVGMLKVENLGFLDLNFSNVQTFRAACEWIGTAYANAERYQLARAEAMVSGDGEILSYSFLARQTRLFTSLAQRIGFDVSMLILEIGNYSELSEAMRSVISARISKCVGRALRTTDLAFDYKRTGAEFAVVLPGTGQDQVSVALQKLNAALTEEFATETDSPVFVHRIQVLHETQKSSELAGTANV